MKIKTKTIFFLVITLYTFYTFASCAGMILPGKGRTSNPDLPQEAEELIQETLDREELTGLSAALVCEGEVLFARGFGERNAAGEPVTEHTLFQIGSVSKIVTALAVMNLAEEGVVDLDEDIRRYLPDFSPKLLHPGEGAVTIRDLLTHHSGIPSDYMKDFTLEQPDPDYFMNMSSLLSEEYLTWEGGTVFAYNNAGFSLLGELVGTVSGMSYSEYVETRIFRPAGMADARVFLTDRDDPRVSGGFTAGEPEDLLYVRDVPAGSILLSARDMAALLEELLACSRGDSDRILRPETLRSMFVRQNGQVALDSDFEIGLTFWLKNFHNSPMVEHAGTIPPFRSSLKFLPERGVGIFLSVNDNLMDDLALDSLAEEVLALVIADGNTPEEETSETDRQIRIPGERELASLEGSYSIGNLGFFSMEVRSGQLWAALPGMGVKGPVVFYRDNSWEIEDTGIRFLPVSAGSADTAEYFCYLEDFFLGAVLPVVSGPLPESWHTRLGRYVPETTGGGGISVSGIDISYDKDAETMMLTIDMRGQRIPSALTPLSETLLQVQGYGRNLGYVLESSREDSGDILKYGGIRFVKSE